VVTIISPLLVGLFWRKHKLKNLLKAIKNDVVQKDLPSCAQQEASQSRKPPQGAGIPSKPRDIKHLTKVKDKQAQDVPKI
jgi:uncharacterized protein (UPF0128 family)